MIAAVYTTSNPADDVKAVMQDYADTTGGAYIEVAEDGSDLATKLVAFLDECPDCNSNGVSDPEDVIGGTSLDCNSNGRPDECEILVADCNGNGIPDDCEVVGENGLPVLFVDRDATGADTGMSWENAFTDLQDALAAVTTFCEGNSEIWVAEGTYAPAASSRTTSFELIDGIAIYGGFKGDEIGGYETALNQRDIATNETILSGDLPNSTYYSYHVVHADTGVGSTAVLDGFTITDGSADLNSNLYGRGAGLRAEYNASPVIRNCLFLDNYALLNGGGAFVASDVRFENCVFDSNRASYGGAVTYDNANPTLSDCTFESNTGSAGIVYSNNGNGTYVRCQFLGNSGRPVYVNYGSGTFDGCSFEGNSGSTGAIRIYQGHGSIRNCEFTDNAGSGTGAGAVSIYQSTSPVSIEQCQFVGNTWTGSLSSPPNGGGAVIIDNANATIDQCKFVENVADDSGGALFLDHANTTVSNCFFTSNGALGVNRRGGAIFNYYSDDLLLFNSVFTDNYAGYGGAISNYNSSPTTIVNCSLYGNTSARADGGGGLGNSYSQGTNVVNSILQDNVAFDVLNQVAQNFGTTSLNVSRSNVQGGESAIVNSSCSPPSCELTYAVTNIDTNALFINPQGQDGHVGSLDDNLRLQALSPCVDAGTNAAVLDIPTDADGYDRIVFDKVDMGAYEAFQDCNVNAVPDAIDLMDANSNGAVDLEDFQQFQLCFGETSGACLDSFDRALPCGTVDLEDFKVFKDQLAGPPETQGTGGGGQAKVLRAPKMRKTEGAWYAKVLDGSPAVQTAALAFELQPLGGGRPVSTLEPHTAYELHYAAEADGVSFYLMYTAAAGSASGPDLIQPAVTGPWSDDHMFILEDGGDEPLPAASYPGLRWTDWVLDLNYLAPKAKGNAPSAALGCTIITGDPGELGLDLYMFFRPRESDQAMVVMEANATFTVQGP